GGVGIVMIRPIDDHTVEWNGERVPRDAADDRLLAPGKRGAHIVTEVIEQSAFTRSLHPGTTNTVRFVPCLAPQVGGAFLLRAVLRIGTSASAPVDNFSKGGLSALIDSEHGTLSRAATFPKSGRLEWRSDHPDTGARLEGATIPRWAEIRERFLDMAS